MNTAIALVICPRCDGTGRYTAPTRYGPECFRCEGAGKVRPTHERAYKAPEVPEYIPLEPYIVSDQSRAYIGATWNRLQIRAAELAWERGNREIRNPRRADIDHLPRYR